MSLFAQAFEGFLSLCCFSFPRGSETESHLKSRRKIGKQKKKDNAIRLRTFANKAQQLYLSMSEGHRTFSPALKFTLFSLSFRARKTQ